MNTRKLPARSRHGSVLIISIATGALLGIVVLSFLQVIQARTLVRARSYSWNQAIPVLDSGIEEALTHLQIDGSNITANGWVQSGTGAETVYRRSGTNADKSFFIVTISNATSFPLERPVVYSQGFVPAPISTEYISRLVAATLTNSPMFSRGIAARGRIDLNGQSIVDSFASDDTNSSTGGVYDPAKRKSTGSVVTNYRGTPAIDVGNGHIYGKAITGPGGTATYNSDGTIGDTTWSTNNSGIQPGYLTDDANIGISDVSPPPGGSSWLALASIPGKGTAVDGTNYNYILNGDRTVYGDFTLHDPVIVTGPSTLYITGDLSMNGNALIYIAPGGSLKLYVGGASTTINGGGIVNGSGLAQNFSYLGLPGNTDIKYAGGADFVGTINAPSANFTISGGASVYGAAIVNTYTSKSSGAGFHFDESVSIRGLLKVASYREL